MQYNPFDHLIETKKFKYARILRSTYIQRIVDCFKVFYGDIFELSLGILDYVFPFARGLQEMYFKVSISNHNHFIKFINKIFFACLLTLNILKFVISALLTFISLPIISVVHMLVYPSLSKLNHQINNIVIKPVVERSRDSEEGNTVLSSQTMILKNLKDYSASEFIISPITKIKYSKEHYDHSAYLPLNSIIYLGVYSAEYAAFFPYPTKPINLRAPNDLRAVIEINYANWRGISALLHTNSSWSATNLDAKVLTKKEDFHEVVNNIILPRLGNREFLNGMAKLHRNKSSIKSFINSPIYDTKLTVLIFEFAGFINVKNKISSQISVPPVNLPVLR